MNEKLTKERLKGVAMGAAIGVGATMVTLAVSGVGGKISKKAFMAGARMVGYRAGVSNIGGYSLEQKNIEGFDNLSEFDSYVEELYEEYMDQDI